MKLKQRMILTILGGLIMALIMLMTFTIYFYSESYISGDTYLPNARRINSKGILLEDLDRIRPFQKKSKRVKIVRMNDTHEDSNRAIEVQLGEKEYEELLQKKQILKRPSKGSAAVWSESPKAKFYSKVRFTRECTKPKKERDPDDDREEFPDLVRILKEEETSGRLWKTLSRRTRITLQETHEIEIENNLTRMEAFHLGISDVDLYAENDIAVDALLKAMETMQIVHVEEKPGGTQLKLLITFYDGSQAMLKPMRFDRQKETEPNHFYFVDFERHNSEIAAFHLDRILDFRRCPPVVGRKLNITTEIYAVTTDEMLKTFFISPAQNICFHGHCSYYCDTSHAICGRPDTVEGSMAAYLPPDTLSGRKSWKNPWRRTYHKRRKAAWEINDNYCLVVRRQPLYNNSKRLADLIDTSILDFLIGNMDRHHYETFKIFGNDSYIIHLDHGRGFGKANHDEISILAPLYQCCFIHIKTFHRLLQLQLNTMKLSTLMRCSLYKDPLNPVLLESHLKALDRRLEIVLQVLRDCFQKHESDTVLYYDTDIEDGG